MTSLREALSKIEAGAVAEQLDTIIIRIIAEMSQAAEAGQDTLKYTFTAENTHLIPKIMRRLMDYFPDVRVALEAGGVAIVIDWS